MAEVRLKDGRSAHVRPITSADGPALREFHEALSDRTIYLRFFGQKRQLTDADVDYFTGVDQHDRVAIVAVDGDMLVGVCRYDVLGDGSAEIAFVIRDDWQGQGLGSQLLELLADLAREGGIGTLIAEVLPDNAAMLATFHSSGYDVSQRRDRDGMVVSVDIRTRR